ncbi:MAG: secondary thiamine-phosphate synthase enzyme YjbQ [Candidatus Bipolaricaulota bacterium]|nr:secondary thiamine-phosphate synthase enzyme YjbQ [Candidatus Bipolaricaulota bacterium]MBS3814118.1 secondary thiamine-phosphate synthase enzyme YjbQ [Candidatus Bipolaricaulota bacterium]MBS3825766.1 secondary thiamine-phosphate synthase enzyme YjbQ [Candidatus Bipolaricaulota bacterium]
MLTSISTEVLKIQTTKAPEFIDITDEVVKFVEGMEINSGALVIYSRHTTAAVRINENETLLKKDMAEFLNQVAPEEDYYRHNDFSIRTENMTEDEVPNGHAHCQSLGLGASETIPVINGELQLGNWQRVFLIELDHAREREVILQVLGG